MNLADLTRFISKFCVEPATECWLWCHPLKTTGYAPFSLAGRDHNAHKVSYEHFRGSVAAGMVLDHLCRTRHCVNPWHLEVVTRGENVRRGEPARRTHCPSGHSYSVENTRRYRGRRYCMACQKARR